MCVLSDDACAVVGCTPYMHMYVQRTLKYVNLYVCMRGNMSYVLNRGRDINCRFSSLESVGRKCGVARLGQRVVGWVVKIDVK